MGGGGGGRGEELFRLRESLCFAEKCPSTLPSVLFGLNHQVLDCHVDYLWCVCDL